MKKELFEKLLSKIPEGFELSTIKDNYITATIDLTKHLKIKCLINEPDNEAFSFEIFGTLLEKDDWIKNNIINKINKGARQWLK